MSAPVQVCTGCGAEKALEEFKPGERALDGPRQPCRVCFNAAEQERRRRRGAVIQATVKRKVCRPITLVASVARRLDCGFRSVCRQAGGYEMTCVAIPAQLCLDCAKRSRRQYYHILHGCHCCGGDKLCRSSVSSIVHQVKVGRCDHAEDVSSRCLEPVRSSATSAEPTKLRRSLPATKLAPMASTTAARHVCSVATKSASTEPRKDWKQLRWHPAPSLIDQPPIAS